MSKSVRFSDIALAPTGELYALDTEGRVWIYITGQWLPLPNPNEPDVTNSPIP